MAKKKRKKGGGQRRVVNKALGWMKIMGTINSLGGEMPEDPAETERRKRELMLDVYLSLDLLARGGMEQPHYIKLIELNYAAFSLSAWLYKHGAVALKLKMRNEFKLALEDCAEAIASMGDRYKQTGKFGASGNELKAIRAGADSMNTLFEISPSGAVVHALLEAEEMTTQFLMNSDTADVRLVARV